MWCVLRITWGSKVKICRQKNTLNPIPSTPLVVSTTDRLKAGVLVFFLFRAALWFLLRGVSCCLALSSCFFLSWSSGLGKPDRASYMLLVHLFVCFWCVSFWGFSSSSWCHGLAVVFDCVTPWTSHLTVWTKGLHCNFWYVWKESTTNNLGWGYPYF